MSKQKTNRRRNNSVTIRMSDDEYKILQNKVKDSGLTQQAYVINSIKGATITPSDEIEVLKKLSKTFADLITQLRGLATNVNQMAHIANGYGFLPAEKELSKANDSISKFRKECEEVWQLIRSSINQQNHMGQ